MKKLLTVLIFVLVGINGAQAQRLSDVPKKLSDTIIQKLELNEQQATSVSKMLSVIQPAMERIKELDIDKKLKATRLMAYSNREKTNMKSLLTDSQYINYLKLTGRK